MTSSPFISIIMPVRNEANFIARSLGAVLAQDYPQSSTEVLIADGMSTDGTREIVQLLQAQHSNLRIIDNPGKIVSTGINAALAQANGDIIVRIDGHCEIASDYVRKAVSHLLTDEVDGVGGPLDTIGETSLAKIIALAMSSSFGVGGSAFRTTSEKTMLTDTVAFPAYTRAIIEKAGLFDEELIRNQDDEYNYRLRKLGAKILLASDVCSKYYSRSSLRLLWRQYFQYGYWKVRVLQKHPLQMQPRQFVPLALVLSLLGALLLSPFSVFGLIGLALICVTYLSAILAASFWVARKWQHPDKPALFFLPICFGILHLAYGLGFLLGLIKFWNRWNHKDIDPLLPTSPSAQVKQ